MSELNDRDYYAARAARATKLAQAASDPEIAAIHLSMVTSYTELADLTSRRSNDADLSIKMDSLTGSHRP